MIIFTFNRNFYYAKSQGQIFIPIEDQHQKFCLQNKPQAKKIHLSCVIAIFRTQHYKTKSRSKTPNCGRNTEKPLAIPPRRRGEQEHEEIEIQSRIMVRKEQREKGQGWKPVSCATMGTSFGLVLGLACVKWVENSGADEWSYGPRSGLC